jgi:hypothetical protein
MCSAHLGHGADRRGGEGMGTREGRMERGGRKEWRRAWRRMGLRKEIGKQLEEVPERRTTENERRDWAKMMVTAVVCVYSWYLKMQVVDTS